jgi:type IV pilus assembly protein PilB
MAFFEQFKEDEVNEKLGRLKREAEERDAKRRAEAIGAPYISVKDVSVSLDALRIVSEEVARSAKMAVLQAKQKELAIVIVDIEDPKTKEVLHDLREQGYRYTLFIASESSLVENAWNRYQEIKSVPEESLSKVRIKQTELKENPTIQEVEAHLKAIDEQAESGSTTEFISAIFTAAVMIDASDVHLEPHGDSALLRFRIDGILYPIYTMAHKTYHLTLNRLKLLSVLKINVTNEPQDGRFTVERAEKDSIEIRVSIIPSEHGEMAVLRVLDPKTISLELSDLGFREKDITVVEKELKRPNGMILVTGPTGSGKTTTLYAFLRHVRSSEIKVITIEDPIEYHLSGIEQTQVDAHTGYTFSAGLRSILRQDPDVLLVGEIRDLETAEIGMHASLTGHLVFSTLHTNNALGAIPRLIDLGVKPSVITPSLNLIIAQRLVRRLCPHCRIEKELDAGSGEKIQQFLSSRIPEETASQYTDRTKQYIAGEGCDKCRNGYKGRIGVFELFRIKKDMHDLISKETSETSLQEAAERIGMIDMQADGILKILDGWTTKAEVERVTGPIDWWE